MKAPPFAYYDPRTVDEVVGLLGQHENARLLAGGQSLMPMLNMRFVLPDHLIDLNKVDEMVGIRAAGDAIEIGAMTRQRAIERDPLVKARAPILAEALTYVGHMQTRSRGTIGGSLCHLDPSAEQASICALYDATLEAAGPRGNRTIAMSDWGLGFMTPAVEPDEALVKIRLAVWNTPHGYGFEEFARRHGDFAICTAAALMTLDGAGNIQRAAISLGGVDVKPVRLTAAENALAGQAPDEKTLAAAAEIAGTIECLSDAQISGAYRQRLAKVLTKRALTAAAKRARGAATA